ncbi:MAG: penicillin acylase family protein [Candidatus Heimdallarchaeota archaeon]
MQKTLIIKLSGSVICMLLLSVILIMPISILPGLGRLLSPIGGIWNCPIYAEYPTMKHVGGSGYSGTVYRDELGIPHIFTSGLDDLSYIIGYLQAIDRLFSMDMQKRVVTGRVSEIMGPSQLEMDKYYRLLGFARSAEELWNKIEEDAPSDPELQLLIDSMEAYCKGVNRYIDEITPNKLPLEYVILGLKPEYWTKLDILTFVKYEAWALTYKESDIAMTIIKDAMGSDVPPQLLPYEPFPFEKVVVPDFIDNTSGGVPKSQNSGMKSGFSQSSLDKIASNEGLQEIYDMFQSFDNYGLKDQIVQACSNNWVINGSLSYSGMPILCNDPHMPLLIPTVLWEYHFVNTSQNSDNNLYGASFPGTALAIIGHTSHISWGMTNSFLDQNDFYLEKLNDEGTKYTFNNTERDIETLTEVIKIKGQPDYNYNIKFTRHNWTEKDNFKCPIINSTEFGYSGNLNISIKWTGYASDYGILKGFLRANTAKNISDFIEAMRVYSYPGLNFIYADVEGNIAIYPKGNYPVRNATGIVKEGRYIMNGSNGEDEWTGYIPFEWIPHKINPENQMYLASANQRTVNTTEYTEYYTSYSFVSSYRSRRINQLLENETYYHNTYGTNITIEKMKKFQTDYYDVAAEVFVPVLLESFNESYPTGVPITGETELLNLSIEALKTWNESSAKYIMDKDLIAPTIFNIWLENYYDCTFLDEFEDANITIGQKWASSLTDFLEYLTIYNQTSIWFDNISTTGITENSSMIMLEALNKTLKEIAMDFEDFNDWVWGNFHIMEIQYLMGLIPAFDFPKYPCSGSSRTLNVASGYSVHHGACMRMIVDLENLLNQELYSGYITIPGGQSGNPMSSHYDDNYQYWKNNEYHRILFPQNINTYPPEKMYSTVIFN